MNTNFTRTRKIILLLTVLVAVSGLVVFTVWVRKTDAGDYLSAKIERGNIRNTVNATGIGVSAGMLTPTVKAALYLQAPRSSQCQTVIASLNQLIYDVTNRARYMTLFYARLNPRERTLQYTNGGHLPGIWFRAATQEIAWLDKGGVALGNVRRDDLRKCAGAVSAG